MTLDESYHFAILRRLELLYKALAALGDPTTADYQTTKDVMQIVEEIRWLESSAILSQ